MKGSKEDYIKYRLERAKQTLLDARTLASNKSWNSTINRLYYACFYAVHALLLKNNIKTHTHNGARIKFFHDFIRTGIIDKEYSKLYSDLFDWRQEGDYADFAEFDAETILPLPNKVELFIHEIEKLLV